ncbi:MAG: aldo/keto reductase [Oscillospiraceae bacterium]|nr:aldo/keto reductase [Oscillospiraceae bacterium]
MLYRENQKNGASLSQLGFGCMRFPRKGVAIDLVRSAEMVRSAIDAGVNYFDTAYIYPGSEEALGQILSGKLRERVNIATKMPLFLVRSEKDFDKFFARQLERLKTDRIDYYMLHMLTDFGYFEKLRGLGIENWIKKEKDSGRIKNIGFSFHGSYPSFARIIDAYDWEFCMIQYNYLDENHQAGTAGLKYAHSKGIPVMVMEPLRGGKLAAGLPSAAHNELAAAHNERTPAEWALKWVLNHPEVNVVLSGMSEQWQVEQNVKTTCETRAGSMTKEETEAVKKAAAVMKANTKTDCTGCGYCMPCPAGVDIPEAFSRFNEGALSGRMHAITHYMMSAGVLAQKPGFASQCVKCGKCEERCPQSIKIAKTLGLARKYLQPFWVRAAAKLMRRFTVGGIKNKNKQKI